MLQLFAHGMRIPALLLTAMVVAACNRGDGDAPLRRSDGSLVSDAGGEVSLSDGSRLQFVITSDRYKQWDAAREGLSKSIVSRYGSLLKPKSPTQQSIARATAFLESNAGAKQSIERTGMSVKDFVLMTVALEQEMQLASARGEAPPPAVRSVDTSAYALPSVPSPYATAYPAPAYPPPPAYSPTPTYPPPPYPDTTYRRDSTPKPIEPPKPIRRDSVAPDTVKRDSTPPPPVPDSTRSLSPPPPPPPDSGRHA